MATPESSSANQPEFSLSDAILTAKENEKKAAAFYASAATKTKNSMVKKLLSQLVDFENIHFAKLVLLENALRKDGSFIDYAGTTLKLPPDLVIRLPELPDAVSTMEVITEASDLEIREVEEYTRLAEKTADRQGHDMFLKLAEEEHGHFLLLRDVYWTLNNLGEWKGPVR